jgi:hypothetical protein
MPEKEQSVSSGSVASSSESCEHTLRPAPLIQEAGPYDVILGRGRARERHSGNRHYQGMCEMLFNSMVTMKKCSSGANLEL